MTALAPAPIATRAMATRLVLAIQAVTAYVLVRLLFVDGPGAFPAAGQARIGPGAPSELKIFPDRGYDGQYVYRLAMTPFTTRATDHGITLDIPGYRQQRILTSLLAHVVSWVPGISTGVAIIIVNAAAVVAAIMAGIVVAADLGRGTGWGLVLGVPACLFASLAADLTEPLAWAGVLIALAAIRRDRWLIAGLALTGAVLSRETAAIVLIGLVVESVVLFVRGKDGFERGRLWLLLPVLVESVWQLRLWQVWGHLPAISGLRNTGALDAGSTLVKNARSEGGSPIPLFGIARTFLNGLVTGATGDPVGGISYLVERIVLVALIAVAAWLLLSRRIRPGIAITVAWCIAVLVVLTLRGWVADLQFLRAGMEAWGLSVFVLLGSRTRIADVVLRAAAVVTGWVTLYFIPRV